MPANHIVSSLLNNQGVMIADTPPRSTRLPMLRNLIHVHHTAHIFIDSPQRIPIKFDPLARPPCAHRTHGVRREANSSEQHNCQSISLKDGKYRQPHYLLDKGIICPKSP